MLGQQLVEAKLRRMYAEGVAARSATSSAAADVEDLGGGLGPKAGLEACCGDAGLEGRDDAMVARADANMAALLEEVELEGEGCVPPTIPLWIHPYIHLRELARPASG